MMKATPASWQAPWRARELLSGHTTPYWFCGVAIIRPIVISSVYVWYVSCLSVPGWEMNAGDVDMSQAASSHVLRYNRHCVTLLLRPGCHSDDAPHALRWNFSITLLAGQPGQPGLVSKLEE